MLKLRKWEHPIGLILTFNTAKLSSGNRPIVNDAHFVDIDHPLRGPGWDTILQP